MLPGIKPRMNRLFGSGFTFFSVLMAQIYAMAGLLPPNHPYLNPQNHGRFGVHHVIAEAANNLKINRHNLDKLFIFIALLVGAILLVMQFVIMIGMFFINTAWAIPIANMFDTLNPQTDIAFNLLTLVFGVPDVFCSSSSPGVCNDSNALVPFPIHNGLHDLFQFYSFGLLLIGVLIFLYFVVVILAETATTGSPFGRRFQNVWVPVRLVVALGLLVPINYGLNTGQYLTLYAAKLGSSLATNGWLRYNNTIEAHSLFGGPGGGANPLGEKHTLISVPKIPSAAPVVQAMSIVHSCAYSYWASEGTQPEGPGRTFADDHYHYGAGEIPAPATGDDPIKIRAWFVKTSPNTMPAPGPATRFELTPTTSIQEALDFYGNGNITIRFGEYKNSGNPHDATGEVMPYCGDITIPVLSVQGRDAASIGDPDSSAAMIVLYGYFRMIRDLWFRGSSQASDDLRSGAIVFNENSKNIGGAVDRTCSASETCGPVGMPSCAAADTTPSGVRECESLLPSKQWSSEIINDVQTMFLDPTVVGAWTFYANYAGIEIEADILNRGWAGAGMWFNRLAHLNGSFQDSVVALPQMSKYPIVMEEVRDALRKENAGVTGTDIFKPRLSRGKAIGLGQKNDTVRATTLYNTYKHWNQDGGAQGDPEKEVIYNAFMDAMNMIMGTDGLFDIRGANVSTHPLVQLIMIGKGMVESTIRNLGVAAGASFMGGIAKAAGSGANNFFSGVSGMMTSTAFLGLTVGIVLFYVLPFLPFIYFFFAVGSWIKTIFEAMVGVPLWALAHLRLDGDGLPGEAASNGYFLLLEIGIRPILTVFGLIAALLIFTAQVRVLNFIWDLVVENSAGYSDTHSIAIDTAYHDPNNNTVRDSFKRGIIDQFFFTVIYTIIVYMLATASFKLIDSVPDNILRWGGIGVSSFGDQNQDPLDGLQRYVAMGGMIQGQQLTSGAVAAFEGTGAGIGGMVGKGVAR